MKNQKSNCDCETASKIVLSCSGAADLGCISDKVARKLNAEGIRKMGCLALAGANIESSINSFKSSNVLLIDGCAVECGKKILDNNEITNYSYLKLTDLGLVKGETEVTDHNINMVYNAATSLH